MFTYVCVFVSADVGERVINDNMTAVICTLPVSEREADRWRDLDTSPFNGDKPNSYSCYRCSHDSITNLFLSVTFMCATHLVMARSSLPEQVLLLFTHSFLCFNKSQPWKRRNKCGGNLFPSTPPDAVYMLLQHDMPWQVCSDLHYLFHNALSRPPATSQRPFAPCLGKYAQVLSSVTIRWLLSSIFSWRGVWNMNFTYWWFSLKYVTISCIDLTVNFVMVLTVMVSRRIWITFVSPRLFVVPLMRLVFNFFFFVKCLDNCQIYCHEIWSNWPNCIIV